jgi:hypothetical protein
MKHALVVLLFFLIPYCWAQSKFEIKEFSGTLKSIEPYWSFAYQRLVVAVPGEKDRIFIFNPKYGELILDNFKVADPLKLRVKINPSKQAMKKKVSSTVLQYWFRDYVVGIEIGDKWIDLEEDLLPDKSKNESVLILDQLVVDEVWVDSYKRGFVVEDGVVVYSYFQGYPAARNQDIEIGDKISVIGRVTEDEKGSAYPKDNIKKVIGFTRLYKDKGTIKSLLYKQNYTCIGLVLNTASGEIKLSFPSNYAERIQRFADKGKPVISYFTEHAWKDELNPTELHALIQGSDTLKILEYGFFGGADIKHEHKPADITGKITKVNKLESGTIYSVILDNESFIDIDFATQKQIGHLLKRGTVIEVQGNERIKAEGELYSEDYRIIIPSKIIIDKKVFASNQLP